MLTGHIQDQDLVQDHVREGQEVGHILDHDQDHVTESPDPILNLDQG